jgi:phosphatidylethanolamine-binding protein (PEBP) family uncharacterized protein
MRARPLLMPLLVVLLATGGCVAHGRQADAAQSEAPPSARASGTGSPATFTLSSPAVTNGQLLPAYRCEPKVNGVEASIPLAWSGVPVGTGSLAVVMHHDPFPGDTTRVSSYLLLWGIAPSVSGIPFGGAAAGSWFMGANKDGTAISYTSPCSRGAGTHEYTITLYALSEVPPSLPGHSSLDVTYRVLGAAISTANVLGTATLTFTDTTP